MKLVCCVQSRPASTVYSREKRDLERNCRENIDISVEVVRCVHSRPASKVDSVLRSDAVQNILCWLACSVHNGPPSPRFQIPPSQLRQRADRAAGLSVKGLWYILYCVWSDRSTEYTVLAGLLCTQRTTFISVSIFSQYFLSRSFFSMISPSKQPMRAREIVCICSLLSLQFGQTKDDDLAFGSKWYLVYGYSTRYFII